jgi:mono/diheme cytochrome c family protein
MKGLAWIALILPLLYLVSCQTENSSTLDASTFAGGAGAVQSIFAQHCTGCHSYQAMSVSDMVAAGLLVKGDPSNSPIYYRLIGAASGAGPHDMPQSGGALNASDVAAIQDFVQNAQ